MTLSPTVIPYINTLQTSIHDDNVLLVEFMLKKLSMLGIPLNQVKFSNGNTPLHEANVHRKTRIMQLLYSLKADINEKNKNRDTPLQVATKNGLDDMVTWLCQHNAKLETTDANGETALQVASKKTNAKIVAILCLHGANTEVTDHEKRTPLIEASYAGDLETVKALYHGHANINATDIRNITSLHYAAIKGHWQVVAFLLQSGINIKVAANLDFKNPRLVEDSPIPSIREFVKRNKAGEFGNEFNKLERLYAKFGFYMAHTENAFMPTIPRKTALYYAVLGGCIKTTLILLEKYVATDFQFFKMEIADVLYYLIDNIEFKNKILSEYSHLFNNKDFLSLLLCGESNHEMWFKSHLHNKIHPKGSTIRAMTVSEWKSLKWVYLFKILLAEKLVHRQTADIDDQEILFLKQLISAILAHLKNFMISNQLASQLAITNSDPSVENFRGLIEKIKDEIKIDVNQVDEDNMTFFHHLANTNCFNIFQKEIVAIFYEITDMLSITSTELSVLTRRQLLSPLDFATGNLFYRMVDALLMKAVPITPFAKMSNNRQYYSEIIFHAYRQALQQSNDNTYENYQSVKEEIFAYFDKHTIAILPSLLEDYDLPPRYDNIPCLDKTMAPAPLTEHAAKLFNNTSWHIGPICFFLTQHPPKRPTDDPVVKQQSRYSIFPSPEISNKITYLQCHQYATEMLQVLSKKILDGVVCLNESMKNLLAQSMETLLAIHSSDFNYGVKLKRLSDSVEILWQKITHIYAQHYLNDATKSEYVNILKSFQLMPDNLRGNLKIIEYFMETLDSFERNSVSMLKYAR